MREMSMAKIIKPSVNPFSSLTVLVRNDKGWKFYMDYRALNKLTIPKKSPIPTTNELLDELRERYCFLQIRP